MEKEQIIKRVSKYIKNVLLGESTGHDWWHIVIEHLSFKGGFDGKVSLSDEGKIVQDADRIDAIGAIGIARVFAYGGKQGREIYNPDQGIVELKNEDE